MGSNDKDVGFKILHHGWDEEEHVATDRPVIRDLDILLIEKSFSIAEPYKWMIRHFIPNDLVVKPDLKIDVAATPKQAVKLIKKYNYDIVFMSIGIPVEPWLKVAGELKEISAQNLRPYIPVIAITNCDPDSQDKCLAGGFDDMLDAALLNPNHFLRTFRKFRLW